MSAIKLIVSILFVILVAAFAVINQHSISVNYYDLQMAKQSIAAPVIVVALGSFVIGFMLAWSFTVVSRVKSKAALGKRNRAITSLEQDVERLKSPSKTSGSAVGADSH